VLPIERHPDLIRALHKVLSRSFINEKIERMIKLYMVFNQLLTLKGQNKTGYLALHNALLEYFGFNLFEKLISDQPIDIIKLIYIESKRRLVETDLYSFQKDVYIVNAKLNNFVSSRISEARVDHATAEFLKETLSVVLNWNHPMVISLNSLIDTSTEFLLNYWDESVSSDFLFEVGLSKYKVSKGVFSMRASSSIILAESAVLKAFLTTSKDFVEGRISPSLNDSGFMVLKPVSPPDP